MKKKLSRKHRGATLAEYALLIALISVVAVAAVRVLGRNTSTSYYRSASHVRNA